MRCFRTRDLGLLCAALLVAAGPSRALAEDLGIDLSTGAAKPEKRRDIGVLKSLGATRRLVLHVFLAEGLLIGGLGTGLGAALGWGLIAVLRRYPFVRLPGDVYLIERLPVRPEAGDFAAVILAALSLCLAAAIYPAWRASRLDPVDAIRRQA